MPTRPPQDEDEDEAKVVDLSDPTTFQTPAVLCFFSHHRPWLVDADLQILELARDKGWRVSKVWEDKQAGVSGPFIFLSLSRLFIREDTVEQARIDKEGRKDEADSWFSALFATRFAAQPAFPEDGGDLAIRSTVHGWLFTRP